ncbi:T9SS type A sorting domain-containing protein [Pontibacter populi]|uniref:T9SS type A sorting domain-containing protein n=1 Tax=Pontibacter populi TaxID=890055 RepID=A0ABV1RSG7_9BACT
MRTFTLVNVLSSGKRISFLLVLLLFVDLNSFADVIKWRGGNGSTATDWNTADNWEPKKVPGINDDVVIGDTDMTTGKAGPVINDWADYTIKSLTIGEGKVVEFYMAPKSMRVTGNVKIGVSGYLRNLGVQAFYGGSFTVVAGGRYSEVAYAENSGKGNASKVWPVTEFYGTGTISGLTVADVNGSFSNLLISGSITLDSNLSLTAVDAVNTKNDKVSVTINPQLYITGSLNPKENQIKFQEIVTSNSGSIIFSVAQRAVAHVQAEDYIGNYINVRTGLEMFPTQLDVLGEINYSGGRNQNILSGRTYGVLRISGTGIKSLSAHTNVLSNLFVDAATLDIKGFNLNRTALGGTMSVANYANLMLSASNFPSNYETVDLGSSSTVEYYGVDQNVTYVVNGYGNLHLTGSGTKEMPTLAANVPLVIGGNLKGAGSAKFRALSNMDISGDVDLSETAIFRGGLSALAHTVGGDWINNADFEGESSTVILKGTTGDEIRINVDLLVNSTESNEFNNLIITGKIDINVGNRNVAVKGDLETRGAGTLTQTVGGVAMKGAARSIKGTGITLNNLYVSGTIASVASFTINGNYETIAGGAFTATGGTITFTNKIDNTTTKNITHAGSGKTQFYNLNIAPATTTTKISTVSDFFINSNLSGNGLTATQGTITFNGNSTFSGEHDLFNVSIESGKKLKMGAGSTMGIAGLFTGVNTDFDVTAQNTVNYNGGNQNVNNVTYHHLKFSGAETIKTAISSLVTLGDIVIGEGVTFAAGDFVHELNGNWVNAGTLSAANGAINFTGNRNTTIEGVTTFNKIQINKSDLVNFVTLDSEIQTTDIVLATGFMKTGANSITVIGDRSGTGWIEGTITREPVDGFNTTTEYTFNGPYVTIKLGEIVDPVTTISVTTTPTVVTFKDAVPVNRLYYVQANGSYKRAKIRLQYEDSELNGNTEVSDENGLKLSWSTYYPNNVNWSVADKIDNQYEENWVEDDGTKADPINGFTNLNKYWAISDKPNRYVWTGEVDEIWEKKANWMRYKVDGVTLEAATEAPATTDIVELGSWDHKNEPVIGSEVFLKGLLFKPDFQTVLTISNTLFNPIDTEEPALRIKGNLSPVEVTSQTHTIITNDRELEVRSNLQMDNGLHKINITKNSGEIIVNNSLIQNTAILNIGSGNLRLKGNYINNGSENFITNEGTVTYEGGSAQTVADIPYHHLVIDKTGGAANFEVSGVKTIGGNLTITDGTLVIQSSEVDPNTTQNNELIVSEDLTIANTTSAKLRTTNTNLNLKGNWINEGGAFEGGSAIVRFTGTEPQSVSSSEFINLEFDNASAEGVSLNGDVAVDGDVKVLSGTLNLDTYKLDRTSSGGLLHLADESSLIIKGENNFPLNFGYDLSLESVVNYNATINQLVAPVAYGKLTLSNSSLKSLAGLTTVNNELLIEEGTSFTAGSHPINLSGDLINKGEITLTGNSTLTLANTGGVERVLKGTSATARDVDGKTVYDPKSILNFYNLTVQNEAKYRIEKLNTAPEAVNPIMQIAGSIDIKGTLDAGTSTVYVVGDFINSGILTSSGQAIFVGVQPQNISLMAPINPGPGGAPTVVFTGNVPPVLKSDAAPAFGNVVIQNTGGVKASVGWGVAGMFRIDPGATFDGGSYTHKVFTIFENNGTFKSSGLLEFLPPYPLWPVGVPLPKAFPFRFGNFESTGTLRFGGSGQIILAGSTTPVLNNLIVANNLGISTTTLDPEGKYVLSITDWNIDGNLVVESGATLNAVPLFPDHGLLGTNFFIKGELINSGTIASISPITKGSVGLGGNFTFTGSNSKISGNGVTMIGDLTVANNASLTIGNSIMLFGNLAHNGVGFNSGENKITFVGPHPSSISTDPIKPLTLSRLVIDKSDQASTVNVSTNIDKVLSVDVEKGVLDLGESVITVHPNLSEGEEGLISTSFKVLDGATVKVDGLASLPNFDAQDIVSLAPTSTVEYYGANQQVKSVQYGNLVLTNTGTATFETGHAKVAGNFVVAGELGQLIEAPTTFEFNGASAQDVAAIDYNNLIFSNAGTKTFASGIIGIAGDLTIAAEGTAEADAITNSTTINYNGSAVQAVLPINYYNLTLSESGTKTFTGTTAIRNTFDVTTPGLANLSTAGNTIEFDGADQSVPGLTYKTLKLSGSGEKTLLVDAIADEQVIMNGGILNTDKYILTLGNTANLVGENNNSYVYGKVVTERTFGETSGNSVVQTQGTVPQAVTATSHDFGNMGIQVSTTDNVGTVTVERTTGTPIKSDQTNNYSIARDFAFTVSGTNSNLNASVVFNYLDWESNNLPKEELRLHSFEGGKWIKQSTSAPDANNTLAAQVKTLTRLTLGSNVTPLPVELLSFTATKKGNNAELRWATASEQNNKGFEVQVSTDGNTYQRLGFVESRVGSSATKQEYSFTDTRSSKNGVQYYRLKQIDFDGTSKMYGPKTVNFGIVVAAVPAEVYPNPFKNKLRVNISTLTTGVATIKLYTATGRLLKTEALQVQAGINDNPLSLANTAYEPGLYLLVIELNGQQQTLKLMKE